VNPVELLSNLIRFDTTNPPGNERGAILWIKDLFERYGLEGRLYGRDEMRPNLIVRIPGRGNSQPIMVYGHVDVVPVEGQRWSVSPFSGEVRDGFVWGRGALDMKGPLAMYISALMNVFQRGQLSGDVLFVALSDEEGGGDYGARFLVENHPEIFEGIRYAIGEFGGFSIDVMGRRFYPVMVSEKQISWMRLTFRGQGGHGSMRHVDTAAYRAARALVALHERSLPVHISPVVRKMFSDMASHLPFSASVLLRGLLNPSLTDFILSRMGEAGRTFYPLFHNIANPTVLQGGSKINVIPSEVHVDIDGRLLPGMTPEDLIEELRGVIPVDFHAEVMRYDPYPADVDWGLFDRLKESLEGVDIDGKVIPLLLSGVTDGRFFKRLGIQTYGFTPMKLPPDFKFTRLIHAEDERIPVDALDFGVEVLTRFFSSGW